MTQYKHEHNKRQLANTQVLIHPAYLHALQGFIIPVTKQCSVPKAHSLLFTNEFLEVLYQVCASERDNFHHTHSNHATFLENPTLYT